MNEGDSYLRLIEQDDLKTCLVHATERISIINFTLRTRARQSVFPSQNFHLIFDLNVIVAVEYRGIKEVLFALAGNIVFRL